MNAVKALPKGPQGSLIAGCADELKRDALGFIERCQRDFGDVVPFRIGPYLAILVSDPDLIHQVLVTDAESYTKDAALRNNRAFFGEGLLSSEGSYWRRQRKLASPAFSPKRLEKYADVMVEHGYRMMERWRQCKEVEVRHEMMDLTLGIAVKTLFDVELSQESADLEETLTLAQKYLADRMNDPIMLALPEWVPFPTNVRLQEMIAKVDKLIYRLIAERRANCQERDDLLSTFLAVRDADDGTGMTDRQIRDEVFTLFFAGHETTALTLAWTLYLLSQHGEVEAALLSELKQVLNGRRPGAADYSLLTYTEKVVKESMRLRPPVWAIGREVAADTKLGEYALRKGTVILISQWAVHHDQRYFSDSSRFVPERWSDELTQQLPKFAYFPFGGGPRTCIGNGFAMLEAVLLLAAIVQEFHLTAVAGHKVELLPAVTLRPAHGIRMTLEKR